MGEGLSPTATDRSTSSRCSSSRVSSPQQTQSYIYFNDIFFKDELAFEIMSRKVDQIDRETCLKKEIEKLKHEMEEDKLAAAKTKLENDGKESDTAKSFIAQFAQIINLQSENRKLLEDKRTMEQQLLVASKPLNMKNRLTTRCSACDKSFPTRRMFINHCADFHNRKFITAAGVRYPTEGMVDKDIRAFTCQDIIPN